MAVEHFTKSDIVNRLGRLYGYKNYLELCAPTTGHQYARIDRSLFETVRRLMYRCPPDFSDNLPIDYRCWTEDIAGALAELRLDGTPVDICLVDSHHSYANSRRDLAEAFELVENGGVIVVHDCLPPTAAAATPEFQLGDWCGVTFKAYLDFVLADEGLSYCTVDCDFGCGIVAKNRTVSTGRDGTARRAALAAKWATFGDDFAGAYGYLAENKGELANLISADEFIGNFSLRPNHTCGLGK